MQRSHINRASFTQSETVDLDIVFDEAGALDNYSSIIVTIRQGKLKIYKENTDLNVENGVVTVHLSQRDTAQFVPGTAHMQVNILYTGGERDVTAIAPLDVLPNLYEGIMA